MKFNRVTGDSHAEVLNMFAVFLRGLKTEVLVCTADVPR